MKTIRLTILIILMALPALAFAEVPGILPVQGVLTDAEGAPITGNVAVTFTIYGVATDAAAAVHSETIAVDVDRGFFSVSLGAGATPLDLDVFKNGARELGITVGSDSEMTPRLQFGVTPFAAHAAASDDSALLEGNAAADFVGTDEVDAITTSMVQDAAITTAKLANASVTPTQVASPQSLYRVTNVNCDLEPGTLMTRSTCRASQRNVDSCSNLCQIGRVRVRDCNGNCACSLLAICLPPPAVCDWRGSIPSCPNTEIGVAVGN